MVSDLKRKTTIKWHERPLCALRLSASQEVTGLHATDAYSNFGLTIVKHSIRWRLTKEKEGDDYDKDKGKIVSLHSI